MNKEQAYQAYWSKYAEAYDETSVPDTAGFPRITYEGTVGYFGDQIATSASIWTRSSSWTQAERLKAQISEDITRGGKILHTDEGSIWIKRASPWANRLGDEENSIKRIILNLEIEYNE